MDTGSLLSKFKFQKDAPSEIVYRTDGLIVFIDISAGLDPMMYIPTRDLNKLVKGTPAELLKSEPGFINGLCMIGRLYSGEKEFQSKVVVEKLKDFVKKADAQFNELLSDFLNQSGAFNVFIERTMSYKNYTKDFSNLFGLSYFWLVGDRKKNKKNIPLPVFDKKYGVFVDSETNRIPVYTNSIFAQIAAFEYKEKQGLDLMLFEIPCLGCFLNGLGITEGKKVAEMTYLNNQWKIGYYVSDEGNYRIPNHFILHDQDSTNDFLLVGCADKGQPPVWIEMEDAKNRGMINHDIRAWG